jgi:hypothetical protein
MPALGRGDEPVPRRGRQNVQVVVLCDLCEWTPGEVGLALGLTDEQVRKYRQRGREQLRVWLERDAGRVPNQTAERTAGKES